MKFFVDLSKKQLIKSAASNVALERVVLKRRDSLAVEVIFVTRNSVATMPAGTTVSVALKKSFADSNFLASASGTPPILNLNTVPLEALFNATAPSAIPALLEIRWTVPGETTRTATLTAEIQNSVILGTEGTPEAIPDLKATQTEAQAGTNNEKWMTPLRTAQAIAVLAPPPTWAAVQNKPSTFPPSSHTHTAADLTDFAAAVQSTSIGASQLPPLSYQTTRHTGDGTTTSFQPPGTLTASDSASAISVTINGVMQEPSVDYTLNVAANRIVLDAPLPAGDKIVITRPLLLPSTTTLSAEQIGAASIPALAAETQARQTALQGKASTSHKSTHAIGGSDALTPADIGAQSIFTTESLTLNSNTTLPASRAKIWRINSFSPTQRVITLPTDALNGDVAIIEGVTLLGTVRVDGSSTLAVLETGAISQRHRFFFTNNTWALDRVATHTHFASEITSGTLNISAIPLGTTASTVCVGNDPRLSNSRTPLSHTHAIADTTGLQAALDGKASTSALAALEARVAALEAAQP